MILHALNDYYHRKNADPDSAKHLPTFGLEQKEIPFILVITGEGMLIDIRDTRKLVGKKKVAQRFLVPQGLKKASGVAANLLWDTAEYVLGISVKARSERLAEQHAAFHARIQKLSDAALNDVGIQAVLKFLSTIDFQQLEANPLWSEIKESNSVMSFQLQDEIALICQRPAIVEAALNSTAERDTPKAMCLISGQVAPIERLHSSIKGVWGAQTFGANIVSFNARAFESYGKKERQGENAPVSKAAAFAYTTALNHLLDKNSSQRIQIGDASTIFWTEKSSEFESSLFDIFGGGNKDDPDRDNNAVKTMYESVQSGKLNGLDGDNRFHVVGLSPNAARISIRFYHCLPLRDLAKRILKHFEDLEIARGNNDPQYPSLFRLLTSIVLQGKSDNIPPNLGGGIVNSIFAGENTLYPRAMLVLALQRCRAEQAMKDNNTGRPVRHVSYFRASLIKAYLNRYFHIHEPTHRRINVGLDTSNNEPPYLLGRLFAVFERVQEKAADREINRSIRDAFFGSAMATPGTVFPRLIRLNQYHLRDMKRSSSKTFIYYDRMIREINDKLDAYHPFPTNFNLNSQGEFAVGYYHQRQAFFTKYENEQPADEETADESE